MLDPLKINIRQELSNRAFSYDLITYVPLHISRQRWRGFNQAEDIARTIDFRAKPLLVRNRSTTPQSLLNRQERLLNTANSFTCIDPLVFNKSILICDDVYTTGSTLDNCAGVLKSAGASKIYGYTIAIDEFPSNV
jgi:predicted amidophosphoribosyltransferase